MYQNKKVTALIMAAGQGSRMGLELPKQFVRIGPQGETILETTVKIFDDCPAVDEILITANRDFIVQCRALCERFTKVWGVVPGGKERQDSVREGLQHASDDGLLLVHDAARPYVTEAVILRVLEGAYRSGAAVPVVPVKDTIRQSVAADKGARGGAAGGELLSRTLDRTTLFHVQTPQGFHTDLLKQAYRKAYAEGFYGTDEAGLVERFGARVAMVRGEDANKKITTREDMPAVQKKMRIGQGYDVHRLTAERRLVLCGVEVPHTSGLLGHSDADVALHALMDALLGAAALGDIGRHFPDNDVRYKGISSMLLLESVRELIDAKGFAVGNVDITIIAQKPKLAPYITQMRGNVAQALGVDEAAVNVKATTTERLGFAGREEGIAAEAVCLLYQK